MGEREVGRVAGSARSRALEAVAIGNAGTAVRIDGPGSNPTGKPAAGPRAAEWQAAAIGV